MGKFKDYYQILGIEPTATADEIKAAYRSMAKIYHPDQNPDPAANQKFLEIAQAYRVLSDQSLRNRYQGAYDRRMNGNSQAASYANLERVRRKRASRYNRSTYTQRVRYRGSSPVGKAETGYTTDPRAKRQAEAEARRRAYSFTERYAQHVVEESEVALRGYRIYAFVLRIIIGGILLFSLGMVIDRASSRPQGPEEVRSKGRSYWTISAPGVTTIHASNHSFAVSNAYVKVLPPGREIVVASTPFGDIPTDIYVQRSGNLLRLDVYGTPYSPPFFLIWVLIALCLLTLIFYKRPEGNAQLGTITLLASFVVFGILFH